MESGPGFSLVIMDLTVPGAMGGKDAMVELKRLDPEIKAIVSSGYANDPVMARYKEYGFRGYVVKPYKIEELGRAVLKALT
jgi:DNA-binding NarL/FixJ family response regulator